MIPYEELVAALTSWRERQGLPVRREDLFDVDASLAPIGVAEALAAPLVPDPSPAAEPMDDEGPAYNDAYADAYADDDPDGGSTRLETADVVEADEAVSLAGLGADEDEATFIGSSPAWPAGEEPRAEASPWDAEAGADDATGESVMAPPREDESAAGDALGDALDAALGEGDPTPSVPPQDPAAGDDEFSAYETAMEPPAEPVVEGETFAAAETAIRPPADADDSWPSTAEPANPWEDEASLGEEPPWTSAEAPAETAGADEAADAADLAVDDHEILDEVAQDAQPEPHEAATAVRDPAAPPADFEVDADDVLDTQDAEGTGPDDKDPLLP